MKLFALSFILVLGIIFTGCSKKSGVDYMNVASKSIKQNNITKAVESYQTIIKDYPHSKEAPDAMFRLATLYQNKLVKNIAEKESLEKAVSLFDELNTKYPDSKIAPKALFMSGFILANDIHDFNRATAVFKKFLRIYPNNDLTSSAREELSNMGMTPAEILEKKKASKI
jgi:TolA-binding protein